MSLLDPQMLPERDRENPQFHDLLQAEEQYLEILFDFAEFLTDRMILLRGEGMNLASLERKIEQISGLKCEIKEDAEKLIIRIRYYYDAKTLWFQWKENILKYVPAHLSVIMEYLQRYSDLQRFYAGTALSGTMRYIAYPVEMNRNIKRKMSLSLKSSAFGYVKITGQPKEKNG